MEKIYILLEDGIDGKQVIASYTSKDAITEHATRLRAIQENLHHKYQTELNRRWVLMDRYSIEEITIKDIRIDDILGKKNDIT